MELEFNLPSVTIIRDRISDAHALFALEQEIPWVEDLEACKARMEVMQGKLRSLCFGGVATCQPYNGGQRYTCSVTGDATLEPVFHAMANFNAGIRDMLNNSVNLGVLLGLSRQECIATWVKACTEYAERAVVDLEADFPEMTPRFVIHQVEGPTTHQ